MEVVLLYFEPILHLLTSSLLGSWYGVEKNVLVPTLPD